MSDATNGNECRSGASRNAATATDSAPTLLDRRMYLKLTGAAAASLVTAGASGTAAAAEYEVIEVPAGANEDIAVRSGETFENKLIDVSAHDAELEINARGDGWTIRNVGFLGPTTNSLERRSRGSKVLNLAGDGLVENVYLGDGVDPDPDGSERNMSRDGGIYLHGDDHTGHIEVRRSNVSLWADNGCYCSGPGAQRGPDDGGTVQFTDCYMENNNVSGIRLGTNGSGARNCTIVIDDESAMPGVPRKPEPQIPVKHGRGFWIREGTSAEGVLIEDCDVSCTLDDTHEAVKINDGSACTIRNSRFEGEIDVNGRLRRENLSGDPDLSPPDGVPMSPEEAASGNSNGGGGSDDGGDDDGGGSDLPNRLRIQATGSLTNYEFTVSGDLEAGPEFDTDGTDVISGSTGRGRVNTTGSDDFYFGGEITRFERDGELEVYVDGERVDPDSFLPRELRVSNREYDEPATYEFSISEDLAATDSVNTTDGDEINGRSADGRVNGGADTYRFAGEIDSFAYDGSLDLYVDGEQADPNGFGSSEPARSLSIVSEGPRVEYEFAVSGALEKTTARNGSINGNDEIDGSSASGLVYGGTDSYAFDGELTDLVVDDPAGVTVFLDGEEIEPDSPGLDRTVSIVGTGPRVEYDFTVSGELEKSTARGGSINSGDEVSGSSASGYVLGGTDSYGFDGEISDFAIDDADAATVYVDGEEVDLGGIGDSDSHELTISNRAYDEPATYEFTVSGALDATSSVNPNDEISGSSAQGQVNGGADTYRYSGDVTAFDSDGPLDVTIDGETVVSGG